MSDFITLHITPDADTLSRMLESDERGAMRAGMIHLVAAIGGLAKANVKVRTSNLANSETENVSADGLTGTITFTAAYAGYVHEGTGLFGPHGKRITPVNKTALAWPGAKHPVKSVKGMKGNPFLTNAAKQTDAQKVYNEGMGAYLSRKGGK